MSKPNISIKMMFNEQERRADTVYYNCDEGALAMPVHIRIGTIDSHGHKIMSYDRQVDEYSIWLEDQIKAQNPDILTELDAIFVGSFDQNGITLTTRCLAIPVTSITHAHAIRRVIMELAAGLEQASDTAEQERSNESHS